MGGMMKEEQEPGRVCERKISPSVNIRTNTNMNNAGFTVSPTFANNSNIFSNTKPLGQQDKKPEATESVTRAESPASSRWNSWSHEEEVFLVAAVMDRFFRRGSLASATKGQGVTDC